MKLTALLLMLCVPVFGQSVNAVLTGYTKPASAVAMILSSSPTNHATTNGVAWSANTTIPFTLNQVWSFFGTNEAYGGPALLFVQAEQVTTNNTTYYTPVGGPFYLDPSKLGTNTTITLTISNAAVAAPTNPPAAPKVINIAWNQVNMRLVLVGTSNLTAALPTWQIIRAWPTSWPTNYPVTNNGAEGGFFFTVGILNSNSLTLVLATNQVLWPTTNLTQ